jgi:uncharacterized protein
MNILKCGRQAIAAVNLALLCVPTVNAGWDEAIEAGRRGDHATAMREYQALAEKGDPDAEYNIGMMYDNGLGVPRDYQKAIEIWLKAAKNGSVPAQYALGVMYRQGRGVPQDNKEAARWWLKASESGLVFAQYNLGWAYAEGSGVPQNYKEAAKWYLKAADAGDARAMNSLGVMYQEGNGVMQDYIRAHFWYNVAAAQRAENTEADQGIEAGRKNRTTIEKRMTPFQVAEAQRLASTWKPSSTGAFGNKPGTKKSESTSTKQPGSRKVVSTGSGFVVSRAGQVLTNHHVIEGCAQVRVVPGGGVKVIATDKTNDLALVAGSQDNASFSVFRDSRARLGEPVVAIGYPLRGLLASGPNVTTGAVSALAGPGNDTRLLQLSAPVQPGNSGGPLLDRSGQVIGVVSSKLNAIKVARITGDVPQNVNFAITGAAARAFLDAQGISYTTASSSRTLETADIAETAKRFTVVIECLK